jgi:hypothetical protein
MPGRGSQSASRGTSPLEIFLDLALKPLIFGSKE